MRRSNRLARWTLVLTLGLAASALAGCDDENDPKTWVNKLATDGRRAGATAHLHRIFDERMSATRPTPRNPRDQRVREYLDLVLPTLVQQFQAHTDENIMRNEAMPILADSQDPRAIPALLSAMQFQVGVGDSERLARRAAEALKGMATTIPEGQRGQVTTALLQVLERATGRTDNAMQIRYNSIQTLGLLRAREAVPALTRLLLRPLSEQDISTARAAADALGEIGDPAAVDALIYGLYLNIRQQNAFNHCVRALGKIGAQHAVPRLIATLQGQNQAVTRLIEQYSNIPNAPAPPPGLVPSQAADVLRVFASPDSTQPLLTVLNDHAAPTSARSAAGEALSFIALSNPSQRTQILQAITRVFAEGTPGDEESTWMAPLMAPRLAVIGDPTSVALIVGALRTRQLQAADTADTRVGLLLPLASIARQGDVATFDAEAARVRRDLEALQHPAAPAQAPAGAALAQIRELLSNLDGATRATDVVRDCNDMACYQRLLTNTPNATVTRECTGAGAAACETRLRAAAPNETVRKAAYMLAWTTPAAQQGAARTAILERIGHPDMLVRRSLMTAIDALSPSGCPECVTRLEQLIETEHGQESRIVSHLDAQLLISRLRARAAAPAAAR
jgi:HEAT repeat protein